MTWKVHKLCTNVKFTVSITLLCLFYLLILSLICGKVVYKNTSQVTYFMLNSQHILISMILSSQNIFCEKVVYKNSSQVTYSTLNSQHLLISLILSSHNIFYLWRSSLQKLFTGHILHVKFSTHSFHRFCGQPCALFCPL